jgi:hypothetical protein
MIYAGGCHCGNVRFALDTALRLDQLPLRACQCSFCRRHGAVSTSDPQGRVRFEIRDPARVIRYRFGLRTADFLICNACGIYVAAEIRDGARAWAIVNANTLDDAARLRQAVTPMDYGAEDEAQRQARRKARWTPVVR